MDQKFGSRSLEEIERSESSLSNIAGTSESSNENCADLELVESSPTKDWKLPSLKPSEVYPQVSAFHLFAETNIRIHEKSVICRANLNTMMQIPLLTRQDIEKAKQKKYKYMHLGSVRIGINPLHRSGQDVYVFSALFDQRWTKFHKALLGGIQAPLNAGPVTYTAFPNFSVSLSDQHVLDALTLGIQTKGYEDFKSAAHNIAVFYSTCVRFTNTEVPAVLNSDKITVTMLSYDDCAQPTVPHQIPRSQLHPPESWITAWNTSNSSPAQSLVSSQIHEADGIVTTQFPQSFSAQHGGTHVNPTYSHSQSDSAISFPTTSTQPPQYQIHPDMNSLIKDFDNLQKEHHALKRQFSKAPTERLLAPHSSKNCEHEECKSTCQKITRKPFGHHSVTEDNFINMHEEVTFSQVHRDILVMVEERKKKKYRARPGVGYYDKPIPQHRLKENSYYMPTESEIRKFLLVFKGTSPYDQTNDHMKKMFNWDLLTHEKYEEFRNLVNSKSDKEAFQKQCQSDWLAYMKKNNMWLSFYEFYYGQPHIEDNLVLPQFPAHIETMFYYPKRKLSDILVECNMHQPEESPSEKKQKHQWRKPDGEYIETTFKLPPYEPLQDSDGGKKVDFIPVVYNNSEPSVQLANWSNLAIQQAVEHFHMISKQTYKLIEAKGNESKSYFQTLSKDITSTQESIEVLAHHMDDIKQEHFVFKAGQEELLHNVKHLEKHVKKISLSEKPVLGPVSSSLLATMQRQQEQKKKEPLFTDMNPFKLSSSSSASTLGQPKPSRPFSIPFYVTPEKGKGSLFGVQDSSSDSDTANAHEEVMFGQIYDSDVINQLKDMSLTDEDRRILDTESSTEGCEEVNDQDYVNEDLNFQIPRWKTKTNVYIPQELYSSEKQKIQEFKPDVLRSWSVAYKTTTEISQLCEDMAMQYRCYVAAGKSADMAYDLIVTGFDDILQNWYSQVELEVPGIHKLWKLHTLRYTDEAAAQAAGKKKGDNVLDAAGNAIPNAIGCLCWEIREHFSGFADDQSAIFQIYLRKMRCKDLTQFEEYYNHYVYLVFQLARPFDPGYKKAFLGSLPSWFQSQLYTPNPQVGWPATNPDLLSAKTWGYVKQACIGLIVATCNQMRLQNVSQKLKSQKNFKSLCRQRGLDPPDPYPDHHHRSKHHTVPHHARYRPSMGGGISHGLENPNLETSQNPLPKRVPHTTKLHKVEQFIPKKKERKDLPLDLTREAALLELRRRRRILNAIIAGENTMPTIVQKRKQRK